MLDKLVSLFSAELPEDSEKAKFEMLKEAEDTINNYSALHRLPMHSMVFTEMQVIQIGHEVFVQVNKGRSHKDDPVFSMACVRAVENLPANVAALFIMGFVRLETI